MGPRARCLVALLLVAAPAGARSQGEPTPDAPPAPPACANSTECARRLDVGFVCREAQCIRYLDGKDLLEMIGLKKSRGVLEPWKLYPSIIPAFGYTPQNGFVLGITTLAGIYLGDPETTTISSLGLVAFFTTKSQFIAQSRNVAILEGNAWQLHGDYRLLLTNQSTYGLGSSSDSRDTGLSVGGLGFTTTVAGEQPMDFNLVRFHQSVLKRVIGPFYAGGSFRFDRYFGIQDLRYAPQAVPPVITSHAAYSQQFGFPTGAYNTSGVGLEAVFDTRDSTINAYRGWYLNASYRFYPEWLGSTRGAQLLYGEARTYVSLSADVPRNVLAVWVLAQGVTSGELPYLALPSIGWDFAGRTGRGYVQGRFRGTAEVYAEAEWRFRLTRDGFLGGAVFANASTFSRPAYGVPGSSVPAEGLFSRIRPAGGFGLRFMMNREARNNVTLDFAFGQDSAGIYFGAGEAF
jgi:Omp85 superfamily domain